MATLNIDLNNKTGNIKPLHGVCCAPYAAASGDEQTEINRHFREGGIPYCRLHDCGGPWGWGQFVDITNVFPDFSADENNPESYNFHYTDEYITAIEKSGCKTYYRLGETIEWGSKKIKTVLPADFEKWARICEHIIMHYNEGWADGFSYNIEYWEVWNEPENPGSHFGNSMWQGTDDDFLELYIITAKHLKNRFPSIKIGGYGSCGFYTITNPDSPPAYARFVPFFKKFLEAVRAADCPLDFFSWHIYSESVDNIVKHAEFARNTLDEYGFTDTESHLNEWNVNAEGGGFPEKHNMIGASFNAAVFAALQNTSYVDKAMYYCFSLNARYNGLINPIDGSDELPWYTFVAFNKLYQLKNAVSVASDSTAIYAAAAENNEKAAVIISNYSDEDTQTTINIENLIGEKIASVKLIDNGSKLEEVFRVNAQDNFKLNLSVKKHTVILIELS